MVVLGSGFWGWGLGGGFGAMGGSWVVVPIGLCLNGGRWMGSLCLCPPNVIGERCQFGATTFNLTAGMGGGDGHHPMTP